MLVDFEDDDLRRLYQEPDFRLPRVGRDVVRAFRKVVGAIVSANDERDLYGLRSLRFEKLKGPREGQRSLRLNDQWRLIARLEARPDGQTVIVIAIEDYH